jgi:hypothetical protein
LGNCRNGAQGEVGGVSDRGQKNATLCLCVRLNTKQRSQQYTTEERCCLSLISLSDFANMTSVNYWKPAGSSIRLMFESLKKPTVEKS